MLFPIFVFEKQLCSNRAANSSFNSSAFVVENDLNAKWSQESWDPQKGHDWGSSRPASSALVNLYFSERLHSVLSAKSIEFRIKGRFGGEEGKCGLEIIIKSSFSGRPPMTKRRERSSSFLPRSARGSMRRSHHFHKLSNHSELVIL